jgi:hypothetical protein
LSLFFTKKSKDFEAFNWYKTLVKNEAEKPKKMLFEQTMMESITHMNL